MAIGTKLQQLWWATRNWTMVRMLMQLQSPAGRADPYRVFAKLRAKGPVIHVPKVNWIVPRYAEAAAVLRDPRFSSDFDKRVERPGWDLEARRAWREQHISARTMRDFMLFKDDPDHGRLRKLVSGAFTPRVVEAMRGRIETIANELLDAVEPAGGMDLIPDFAYPVPMTVICELLGVPAEDRPSFRRWTSTFARVLDPVASPEEEAKLTAAGDEAMEGFVAYLTDLVANRRRQPGEDLLSALIAARDGGDRLTENELMSTCVLLLVAGHETTANLIGNGTLALLRHPEELRKLWEEPALIVSAVEELLRYDSPVAGAQRITREDVELAGKTIPAGHDVIIGISSANRDPDRFADPDRLDITREDNKHLAFSGGPHFCLGATLARLEGQVALHTLVQRFPKLRLGAEEPEWRDTITLRGLRTLPVSF